MSDVRYSKTNRYITSQEAVETSTRSPAEILGDLILLLYKKNILDTSEVEELFYWEFTVEKVQ